MVGGSDGWEAVKEGGIDGGREWWWEGVMVGRQ